MKSIQLKIPIALEERLESRRFQGERFHRVVVRHLEQARRSGRCQEDVEVPSGANSPQKTIKVSDDLFDWLMSAACPGKTITGKVVRQLAIMVNHPAPRAIDSKKILFRVLRDVVKDQEVQLGPLIYELSLRSSVQALKQMLEELERDGAIEMVQRAGYPKVSFSGDRRRLSVLRLNRENKES